MQYKASFVSLLAMSAPVLSFSLPDLSPSNLFTRDTLTKKATCPAVWKDVSSELKGLMVTNGQCNDVARAMIRAAFHDCFPDGGCDGSLARTGELSRIENTPMVPTITKMVSLAQKYKVSNADMISFAGAVAIASCPGGPKVKALIGRKDATQDAPQFQLPRPDVSGADAVAAFKAKGFSAEDLAALLGAHTASRQFGDASKSGASEDSTPGIWDILYFAQTILKLAPFTFVSDTNIANYKDTKPFFQRYSVDKGAWDSAFVPAYNKLSVLGNTPSTMADCSIHL